MADLVPCPLCEGIVLTWSTCPACDRPPRSRYKQTLPGSLPPADAAAWLLLVGDGRRGWEDRLAIIEKRSKTRREDISGEDWNA